MCEFVSRRMTEAARAELVRIAAVNAIKRGSRAYPVGDRRPAAYPTQPADRPAEPVYAGR